MSAEYPPGDLLHDLDLDDLPCDECDAEAGQPHEDECSRRVDYDGEED